jgi:hypothetical protein
MAGDSDTPDVPICALPVVATAVILARCSVPGRMREIDYSIGGEDQFSVD